MTPLFADTGYWIALLDPTDDLHQTAGSLSESILDRPVVTSELILVELLNDFAGRGEFRRRLAAATVKRLLADHVVTVVPADRTLFQMALELYARRPDKNWSLTDCASFVICESLGILEALAYDRHFVQAGVRALMRVDDVNNG